MSSFNRFMRLVLTMVVVTTMMIASVAGCGAKNDLQTIKQRGKLIVGTSADYPPMEYVVNGEYVGFDMELIKEIGKRMGLQVEIQDMAFDTLIAALKQGKIDVVIASMSATPERQEQADFTDIYYKSMHGFLTKAGSGIKLNAAEDIASYKVGVQTGTSHEKWIMENLLKTGKMPEQNVLRYEKADNAVLDVASGRLDIFIADLPVAKKLVKKIQGLELALEYDLNPKYGGSRIAVRKGSEELRAELNKVLGELKNEGFIEKLTEKHLSGE